MDSRAILRLDMGFYMGIELWFPLKSIYRNQVFMAFQKYLIVAHGRSVLPLWPEDTLLKAGCFVMVW